MLNALKLAVPFVQSLLPVVFPEQKFNPKRLAGVVVAFVLVVGSIKLIGADNTEAAVELAEDVVEMTEE